MPRPDPDIPGPEVPVAKASDGTGRVMVDPTENNLVGMNKRQHLLFVIDVAMTREGFDQGSFDQALIAHDILFDGSIRVDPALERSLLASRFIDSPTDRMRAKTPDQDAGSSALAVS